MNFNINTIEQLKATYENMENNIKKTFDMKEISQILVSVFKKYEILSEQMFSKNEQSKDLNQKIFNILSEMMFINTHVFKLFFQREKQINQAQKEKIINILFSFGESLTNSTIKSYLISNWSEQFQKIIKEYLNLIIEILILHNEKVIEFTDKEELSYLYPYPYITHKNIKHAIWLIVLFMTYIQDKNFLIDIIKFLIDKSFNLQAVISDNTLLKSDFTPYYINAYVIDSSNLLSMSNETCDFKYSNFTLQSSLLILILLKVLTKVKKYVDVFLHFIEFTCKLNDNNISCYIRADIVKTLLKISEKAMNTNEQINVENILQNIQNIFTLISKFLRTSDLTLLFNYLVITTNSVDNYITQINTNFKLNLLNCINDSIPKASKYYNGITLSNNFVNQPNIYNMIVSPGVKLVYNGESNIISIFQSYKRFTCPKDIKFVLLRIEKDEEVNANCYLEIAIDNKNIYIKENNIMKGISEHNLQMYYDIQKSTCFQFDLNKNEGSIGVYIYINSSFFYTCQSNFVSENMSHGNNIFTLVTGFMSNSLMNASTKFDRYHNVTLSYMLVYNDKLTTELTNIINFTKIKTSKMGTLKTDQIQLRYLNKEYLKKIYKSNRFINKLFTFYLNDEDFRSKIIFELTVERKKIIKKEDLSSNIITKFSNKCNLDKLTYIEYIPKTNYSNYNICKSNIISNFGNNYLIAQQNLQKNHTYLLTNYNIINTLIINNVLQMGLIKTTLLKNITYVNSFLDVEMNNMNIFKYIIVLLNDLDNIDNNIQRGGFVLALVKLLISYFRVNLNLMEVIIGNENYLNIIMFSLVKNKEYITRDVIEKLFFMTFLLPKGIDFKNGINNNKENNKENNENTFNFVCLFPNIITDLLLNYYFFNEIGIESKKYLLDLIKEYFIENEYYSTDYMLKNSLLHIYINLFLQCSTTDETIDQLIIKNIISLIEQLKNSNFISAKDEMIRFLQILFKYNLYIPDHIQNEKDPVENETMDIIKSCLSKLMNENIISYKEQIKEQLLELNFNEEEIACINKATSLYRDYVDNKPSLCGIIVNGKEYESLEDYEGKNKPKFISSNEILSPKNVFKENNEQQIQTNKEDKYSNIKDEDSETNNKCSGFCCLCKFIRQILKDKIYIEQSFLLYKQFTTDTYKDIFLIKEDSFFSKLNTINNNTILTLSNTSLSFSYYLSMKEGPNRIRKKFTVKPDLILNQEIDYTQQSQKKQIKKYYFDKYAFHNSIKNKNEICRLDQIFNIHILKSIPLKDDIYEFSCNCLLFKGMTYLNSVLILGKNNIYIITNIIQDNNNIIYSVNDKSFPKTFWILNEYDDILKEHIHNVKHKIANRESIVQRTNVIFNRLYNESKYYCFSYLEINEIFKRKFLHQDNSLEIFIDNGDSLFIAVNVNLRDKIVSKMIDNYALTYNQHKKDLHNLKGTKYQNEINSFKNINEDQLLKRKNNLCNNYDNNESDLNNNNNALLNESTVSDLYIQNKNNNGIIKSNTMIFMKNKHLFLMKKSNSRKIPKMKDHAILEVKQLLEDIIEKWANGFISNFAYLMLLNTLSGRTYNDLSQYPVMPWVISDYNSETINLTNPETFRNLSYPIFAQKEESQESLKLKYEAVEEESMKYHCGSHYSTPGFLSYFLIRVKPFSLISAEIQGGVFDTTDRLFFNIKNLYQINEKYQELIPEIYTLPELFININSYCFGTTTAQEQVNNVKLPWWSLGDPRLFSKMSMKALESCYVSENIHEWIDLIFGYKQKGKDAIECFNLFRPVCTSFEPNKIISTLLKEKDDIITNDNKEVLKQIYEELELKINEIVDMGQSPSMLFNKAHPKKEKHQKLIAFFARSIYSMNFIPKDKEYKYKLDSYPKEMFAYYENVNEFMSYGQGGLTSFRMCYQEYEQNMNKSNDKNYTAPIYFLAGKKSTLIPPSYKNYIDWSKSKYSFLLIKPFKKICYEYHLNQNSTISCIKVSTDGKYIIVGFHNGLLCKYKLKRMKFDYVQMKNTDDNNKKNKKGIIKKIFKPKIKSQSKSKSKSKDIKPNIVEAKIISPNINESNSKDNKVFLGYNTNSIILPKKIDISPSNTFNIDSFLNKTSNNFNQHFPSIYFLYNLSNDTEKFTDKFFAHCTSSQDLKLFSANYSKKKQQPNNNNNNEKNIYLFLINTSKSITSKIRIIEICECFSLLIVITSNNHIFIYDFNSFTLQKVIYFNNYINNKFNYKIEFISINKYTGDFIVGTQYHLILFNINGVLLARLDLQKYSNENNQRIKKINHCIIRSIKTTESDIYIFTAHNDGNVLIWKISNNNAFNHKVNYYKMNYDYKYKNSINKFDADCNSKFDYVMQIKCTNKSIELIKLTEDLTKMICVTDDKSIIYLSYEEYLEKKKKKKQMKTCPNCLSSIGSSQIVCHLCHKKLCSKCKIEEKIPEYSLKNKIPICQDCKGLIMSTNKLLYDF